ncbi:MAG: hypothetical protein ACYSR4_04590 [Planctomycetota bacterium]|jgi:hypothetical protein
MVPTIVYLFLFLASFFWLIQVNHHRGFTTCPPQNHSALFRLMQDFSKKHHEKPAKFLKKDELHTLCAVLPATATCKPSSSLDDDARRLRHRRTRSTGKAHTLYKTHPFLSYASSCYPAFPILNAWLPNQAFQLHDNIKIFFQTPAIEFQFFLIHVSFLAALRCFVI